MRGEESSLNIQESLGFIAVGVLNKCAAHKESDDLANRHHRGCGENYQSCWYLKANRSFATQYLRTFAQRLKRAPNRV
jgi:hypothetical protein